MAFTTTAEFELEGAGLDAQIEVEIKYEVHVPGKGYDDEASVTGYEVTRWRLNGVDNWTKAESHLKTILEGCIDEDWLLDRWTDDHTPDHPDDDDRGDYLRDLRDERGA